MFLRSFLTLLFGLALLTSAGPAQESRQSTGVKVGEVTETSAIIWTRLTAKAGRNADGVPRKGPIMLAPAKDADPNAFAGACPGAPGQVRLRYGARADLGDARAVAWVDVTEKTDFTHQFRLTGLKPATVYHYAVETTGPRGAPAHAPLHGQFETAPPPHVFAELTFAAITCRAYKDIDHKDGFHIYEAMAALGPKFITPNGDNVYYDGEDPRATTVPVARYHWNRMYGMPRHVAFHRRVPGYWTKDDHDCLANDCWPGMKPKLMLPLTFADGLRLFREQVPMGEKTYRTFRWGKGLQIWLVEGRDFRSSNKVPDGPAKTIWGAEQKQWLKDTVRASDADWKVLISPTPVVGPDRPKKADNHANDAFAHEGNEMRQWFKEHVPGNFFVICGDRHWQYHSVHPEAGVHEFCCGAASDPHAGGSPGEDAKWHRFHRVKGGFLSAAVTRPGDTSTITFRLHDVFGKVLYEYRRERPAK